MRIFAAFIAESQTDFIDGFFVGKKISDMKDNRGNKMKDYILRQRLAEYDAKLDLVYRNFSEYVHLAEKAFYSSVTTSSSEQYDIPYWKKYTLSIEEAASYFRIGEGKLRKLVSDNPNAEYLLWNGNRVQIKRTRFEKFIDTLSAI